MSFLPAPFKNYFFFFSAINLIFLLFILYSLYGGLKEELNSWQDDLKAAFTTPSALPPFTLFDIDERTYRQWGSPRLIPRDKLKSLIERAVQGGADVVVIDVDLSRLSNGCLLDTQAACPPINPKTDAALGLYLKKLNERNFDDRQADDFPIILLARTYRRPLNAQGQIDNQAFWEKPTTLLDHYITKEEHVFWAAPIVRTPWPLTTLVCDHDHLTVLPAIPLLAAIAQHHTCEDSTRKSAYVIRDLLRRLNGWANTLPCNRYLGKNLVQICQTTDACPDLTIMLANGEIAHPFDLAATADIRFTSNTVHFHRESAQHVLAEGAKVNRHVVFIGSTYAEDSAYPNAAEKIYHLIQAVHTLLQ